MGVLAVDPGGAVQARSCQQTGHSPSIVAFIMVQEDAQEDAKEGAASEEAQKRSACQALVALALCSLLKVLHL